MTEEVEDLTPEDQPAPPPAEDPPPAPSWSDDDAAEARAFGWKPPTEWQGERPPGYIESPVEYMDRVKRSKTFTAMHERMERQEREAKETARRLNAVNEFALKAQREAFERQLAEISAAQRRAVAAGDVNSFDQLAAAREQIERRPPVPVSSPAPVVEEYRRANAWTENPLIWGEAVAAVDHALKTGHQFASEADQIKFAEAAIYQKYPHLAPKPAAPTDNPAPRPARPAPVESGGLAPTQRGNGGFNALPPEARAAFARFAAEGVFTNDDKGRAAYLEAYTNG